MAVVKQDALSVKAAAVVATAVSPEDAPSEATAVDIDFDFVNLDPTDYMPHLKKHGIKHNTAMAYRWCERDHRVWTRREAQGWQRVEGGKVARGTVILCEMPLARQQAFKARNVQRTKELSQAPMRRLQAEADRLGGRAIEMFDGDRGPRDGL